MNRDEEVRRLLDGPHPVVPADLVPRAAARGRRTLRRRRLTRYTLWTLLLAALATALTLAALLHPADPPSNPPPGGTWWAPAESMASSVGWSTGYLADQVTGPPAHR